MTSFTWITPLWCSPSLVALQGALWQKKKKNNKLIFLSFRFLICLLISRTSLCPWILFRISQMIQAASLWETMLDLIPFNCWQDESWGDTRWRFEIILGRILQTHSLSKQGFWLGFFFFTLVIYLLFLHCNTCRPTNEAFWEWNFLRRAKTVLP